MIKGIIMGVVLAMRLLNSNVEVVDEELIHDTELIEEIVDFDDEVSEIIEGIEEREGYDIEHKIYVEEDSVSVYVLSGNEDVREDVDISEFWFTDSAQRIIDRDMHIDYTVVQIK